MKIETLPLSQITPYDRNPRRNDHAVDAVAASIREFGFKVPIVIDAQGVIVTGHTRYKAAQKLGLTEAPCIRADDLTPEQVRAFRLADNKVGELADWDFDELQSELLELPSDYTDVFFPELEEKRTSCASQDDYEIDNNVNTYIHFGEKIYLGRHSLLCGDSTKETPFGDTIIFDHNFDDENLLFFIPPPDSAKNLLLFSDAFHFGSVSTAMAKGWIPRFEFVWDCVQSWYVPGRPLGRHKTCFCFGADINQVYNTETAIIQDGKKRKVRVVSNSRGKSLNVPYIGGSHIATCYQRSNTQLKKNNAFKYEKPVEWIGAILKFCNASSVYDMFAGSGCAIIACDQLDMTWNGVEIDPILCQNIVNRFKKYNGAPA